MRSSTIHRWLPFALLALFGGLAIGAWIGLWGSEWREISGPSWAGPSSGHWLGTNRIGQDILARTINSVATAFEVGLLVGFLSAFLGVLIGAIGGYFRGSWIDELLLWLTGCFEAIPITF